MNVQPHVREPPSTRFGPLRWFWDLVMSQIVQKTAMTPTYKASSVFKFTADTIF